MNIEYKQIYAFLDGGKNGYKFTPHNAASLSQLGAEGWDLVTSNEVVKAGVLEGVVLMFKRVKGKKA